jgi:DNA-dependent protein kinase catalytic subunit
MDQKERVLDLLKLALLADKAAAVSTGRDFIMDALRCFLGRGVSLAFKGRALALLPMLGPDAIAGVRIYIHDMVTYDFPVSSADLQLGSSALNEYLTVLDELLRALGTTGSVIMLEELFPVLRERAHVHIQAINESLRRMANSLPGQLLRQVVECCLRSCFDRTHPEDLKVALLTRVVAIILERMPQEHFVLLICDRVAQIVDQISRPTGHGLPTPQEKKHVLFERVVCFSLLRSLYDRLSPDVIRATVNTAFAGAGSKGNELTQAVMRYAHNAKSEHVFVDGEHVTNWGLLRYHSAAYSALAAAVMCTQSKE